MKLTSLEIKNFVGIEDAKIEFDRRVSLFAGTNNQGKSSVRDALLYAMTGKCRAVEKFNQAKELARGAGRMGVKLCYADGDQDTVVTRFTSNASSDVDDRMILRYCLNPIEFVEADQKTRAKVLSEVRGGGAEELAKAAIKKHIGSVKNAIVKELKDSLVPLTDIDAFRSQVVDIRRGLKRTLPKSGDKPPLMQDFELPGDFNLEETEEKVKTLAGRIKKGAELMVEAKRVLQVQAEMLKIKNKLTKLDDEPVKVPPAPKVPKAEVDMAGVYLSLIEDLLAEHKAASIKCPLCPKTAGSKRENWLKRQEELTAQLDGPQEAWQLHDDAQIELETQQQQIAQLNLRQKNLQASVKDVKVPKGSENLLDELTTDRDKLQGQIGCYALYEQAVQTHNRLQKDAEGNKVLITECDRIDEALKDGGPVKAAIAAGGKELPINANLLKLWGMEALELSDIGGITLRGIRIETCSKSERYRAASAICMALAEMSGIGICALDEFDMLDKKNHNMFMAVMDKCGIDDVLVFSTSDEDWSTKPLPDWLGVWTVNAGVVDRI